MSLATWQVRGILRVSQELNRRSTAVNGAGGIADSEVIVKFKRSPAGAITMQVLDSGHVEILKDVAAALDIAGG